jgi:outer membrane protein, heavy metal efflux system
MKTRFYFSILILSVTTLVPAADVQSSATNALVWPTNVVRITSAFVAGLTDEMRTNHPALHALRWRANAATENVRSVRTWEDPMARVGGMAAEREMRADDGDIIYGLEQKLPLFGKQQALRNVAQAEAMVESSKVELQFQTMRRDLAKALFRAAFGHRAVTLALQDIAWLDTLVNAVEANYRNGTATLTELIQSQNERAKRINQRHADEARLLHERIALYRFIARDSYELPRLELPPAASPVEFTPKLLRLAYRGEPKLRLMQQELKQGRAAVESARRQRLPDFAIGADARHYSRNAEFRSSEVFLTFNLPWGNRSKYKAEINREHARAVAIEYDIANERNALAEEIHQLTVMIGNARRAAVLYRDEIIPRSRTALEVAHTAWLSGRGMLRDVIEARRMLTEAELMYAQAVSEQYQAMSELVLCCGLGELEALEMIGVTEAAETKEQP